ncbi:MAG: Rieske 2Fe-2S domain-containing protein [Alphaproteobacteria bacterium]
MQTGEQASDPGARDQWVGVGLECQIYPDSAHPVIVDGRELALWRGQDGPAMVWDDRCPHRGMRLSFGFVRDNALRCLYHGWQFDGDGQCAAIPALPDFTPPKTICAAVHGAETKYGIIWANLSASRAAPLPGIPDETTWLPVRSLYLRCARALVIEGIKAFDYGEAVSVDTAADNICILSIGPNTHLLFAIQPIDAEKTGLHIVVSEGEEPTIGRRTRLARQMEQLRGAIEANANTQQ